MAMYDFLIHVGFERVDSIALLALGDRTAIPPILGYQSNTAPLHEKSRLTTRNIRDVLIQSIMRSLQIICTFSGASDKVSTHRAILLRRHHVISKTPPVSIGSSLVEQSTSDEEFSTK